MRTRVGVRVRVRVTVRVSVRVVVVVDERSSATRNSQSYLY